jgi:hypothetical protein
LPEKFLILRNTERDIKFYVDLHDGNRYCFPIFLKLGTCWADFRKVVKYQISLKSIQWEPICSMRTDGQTDRPDEANSIFCYFEQAPKKETILVLNSP